MIFLFSLKVGWMNGIVFRQFLEMFVYLSNLLLFLRCLLFLLLFSQFELNPIKKKKKFFDRKNKSQIQFTQYNKSTTQKTKWIQPEKLFNLFLFFLVLKSIQAKQPKIDRFFYFILENWVPNKNTFHLNENCENLCSDDVKFFPKKNPSNRLVATIR